MRKNISVKGYESIYLITDLTESIRQQIVATVSGKFNMPYLRGT